MSFVSPRELGPRELTHDTRHILLQSENVFELGGITISFGLHSYKDVNLVIKVRIK